MHMINLFNCSSLARMISRGTLLLGILLSAQIGKAQNLLTRPGFEITNTSGWYAFDSATISLETGVVHSGTYAAIVSQRTAANAGIAQSLLKALQNDHFYNHSARVRLAAGTNHEMHK